MARRIVEQSFNPRKPLVARRNFVASGHRFGMGDLFNWRNLSVSQRRVRQMFDSGLIMHRVEQKILPDIENIDSLVLLHEIAEEEGAVITRSKKSQRAAIYKVRKDH